MKFVRFNDWATGLLIDDQVVDINAARGSLDADGSGTLSRLLPDDGRGSWNAMIAHWDEAREPMQQLNAAAAAGDGSACKPLASVQLQAPLPDRRNRIIALGANVAAHAVNAYKAVTGKDFDEEYFLKEQREGLAGWGFTIMPETVVGPEAEIKPEAHVEKLDYECEVGIVLGSGGRRMSAEDFSVWGHTVWNDLSIRDGRLGIGIPLHRGAFSWALEKNFQTGNACGPCVVVDEGHDVNQLRCRLSVNGEERQDWSTKDMIWGFADTVAFISNYTAMAPGDILCSGTGPGTAIESGVGGAHWLKPGDRIEAEVEGVGVLVSNVVEWRDA